MIKESFEKKVRKLWKDPDGDVLTKFDRVKRGLTLWARKIPYVRKDLR